jgi:hypothetical protein
VILRPGWFGTEKFPSTGLMKPGPLVILPPVDQVPTNSDGITDVFEDMLVKNVERERREQRNQPPPKKKKKKESPKVFHICKSD